MPDLGAHRGAPLRIVVLTQRSPRGAAIAAALASAGIQVDAIVVDAGRTTGRARAKQTMQMLSRRGVADTVRRGVHKVRRSLSRRRRHKDELEPLRRYANRVVKVPDANGPTCEELLRSLVPDLLLLGSSRILRANIFAIPRVGTFNPHPGLLPAYRGLDVIPWALYNGDPLGVTVHVVDAGIDTGDIVAQRTFDVQPGDTLRSLRQRADAILGRLMAEVVLRLEAGGGFERRPQQPSSGHLYSRMPAARRQMVEARLQAMAARRT